MCENFCYSEKLVKAALTIGGACVGMKHNTKRIKENMQAFKAEFIDTKAGLY